MGEAVPDREEEGSNKQNQVDIHPAVEWQAQFIDEEEFESGGHPYYAGDDAVHDNHQQQHRNAY